MSLIDGTFETAAGITLGGLASRTTDEANSGSYSGHLLSRAGHPTSNGFSVITWDPAAVDSGEQYALQWYAKQGTLTAPGADVVVEESSGAGWVEVDRVAAQPGVTTPWSARGLAVFTPTAATCSIRVRSLEAMSGFYVANWYVDDVMLVKADLGAVMAVRKWAAINALHAQLKTIDGVGYRSDLNDRVYGRLITPEDGVSIQMPFLSCPLLQESQTYEMHNDSVMSRWRHRIHGFVGDNSSTPTTTDAAQSLADLHDDMIKALIEDLTLGGTVRDVSIIATNTFAGVLEGEKYGELVMDVELLQVFQRSDLGA